MSDRGVLWLVGKLTSRATTLMFCIFPDSDCNYPKNAKQGAGERDSASSPRLPRVNPRRDLPSLFLGIKH